jgi:hypothetical protein
MKIPFSDPIWSRLYGPYGVEDVNEILQDLQNKWDDEVASDLFWERLYHQGTLYPATYAALPWLVEIAPKYHIESISFISRVIAESKFFESEQSQKRSIFQGLSLDHAFSWLPIRLNCQDMTYLKQLEEWFVMERNSLSEMCFQAISKAEDKDVPHLLLGRLSVLSADILSEAVQLWEDGYDVDYILDEVPNPTLNDLSAAEDTADKVRQVAPQLSAFLKEWLIAASERENLHLLNSDQGRLPI